MNRHERRANWSKARKTQQGLAQLQVAAQKLKSLEALPDALKDVHEILAGVNEMRVAMACAIQDMAEHERRADRLEHVVRVLAMAVGQPDLVAQAVAQADAEYDAAHPIEQEEAPVEPEEA